MPEIKEYTSQVASQGFQPTETGIQATAQAARRIGVSYRESGQELGQAIQQVGTQAGNYWEHREISKGAAEWSSFMAKTTDDWNNVVKNADPNDPTLKSKFTEALNEQTTDFQNHFITGGARQWAERSIDSFRNHMNEKMSADMATLAADAITVNARQAANAATLRARADPTAVTEIMGENERIVDGLINSSPNLKGAAAARARENILQTMNEAVVKASWIAKAERNPDAALAELQKMTPDSPQAKYMKSDEITRLVKYAQMQKRQERVYDNYERAAQKALQQENIEAVKSDYLEKITSDDPQVRAQVTRSKVGSDDRLDFKAKEAVLSLFERYNKPEPPARISAANTATAMEDLYRLPDDPLRISSVEQIRARYVNGDYTTADFKFLRDEFQKRDENGNSIQVMQKALFDSVKPALTKATPFTPADPVGASQYFAYQQFVSGKVAEYRKAGKSVSDLFDPGKPDYVGRPEVLDKFSHSMQDTMKYMMDQLNRPSQIRTPAPNEQPSAPKDQSRIGPQVDGPSMLGPDGQWYYRTKDGLFQGRKPGEQ